MNFLTPPTDSLYKFLCISGLVLFIYSIYRMDAINTGMRDEYIRERQEDIEWSFQFRIDTATYSLRMQRAMDERSLDSLYAIQRFTILKKAEAIREQEQLKLKLELVKDGTFGERSEYRLLRIYRVIGAFLFFIGAALWYYKIQRPQDKLLQKQLHENK